MRLIRKIFNEDTIFFGAAIIVLALTVSAMFHGCTKQTQPPPATIPSKPIASEWKWEDFLQANLSERHLSASQQPLCKKQIEARKFWSALLRSIVYAESNFNPTSTYTEKTQGIDPVTGKQTVSVGLLQLSVKDKLVYKTSHCADLNEQNIKDPEKNLGCGLEIMAKLIGTRSDLQASLGRYWSTIRPGHKAEAKLWQDLPECR
jgi:hypothetical protein